MVAEIKTFATNLTGWVVLLCVSFLASACSDDEPVEKTAVCNCPSVESVPVAAGYQAPGNIYQRPVSEPATAPDQMYMIPPRTFSTAPVQQGWGMQSQGTVAAEPAWDRAQQTYEAPQYTAPQTQRDTGVTPWTFPEQSPPAQQFQYDQRPWGQQTRPAQGKQSRAAKDTTRQPPNYYQWGAPVGGGYYGWGAGPYGAVPGAGYPGYAW